MKFSGERVVFDDMKSTDGDAENLSRHLERYAFAVKHSRNKEVLDASAGTCYGSSLLSMVASKIIMADISREALEWGQKQIFYCPSELVVADFNTDRLPECDVCVSFETIEHLEDPKFFLINLKCKELIWSIPLNNPSKFHKKVFKDEQEVRLLFFECGWDVDSLRVQDERYLFGRCTK